MYHGQYLLRAAILVRNKKKAPDDAGALVSSGERDQYFAATGSPPPQPKR
jgi:hypothetical protein